MLLLPNITFIAVDTRQPELAVLAAQHCLKHCQPAEIFILTDRVINFPYRLIPTLHSMADYNHTVLMALPRYVSTEYVMIFQWDGFITQPQCWQQQFLAHDYIGAPWDDGRVGNGGFSLRSAKLLHTLANNAQFQTWGRTLALLPEDEIICRADTRDMLEAQGVHIAPLALATQFSYEKIYRSDCFGFHGFNNLAQALTEEELSHTVALFDQPLFETGGYVNNIAVSLSFGGYHKADYLMAQGLARNNHSYVRELYRRLTVLPSFQRYFGPQQESLLEQYRQLASRYGCEIGKR